MLKNTMTIFCLICYAVSCQFIGENVIRTNELADLNYYLQGFEQYGLSYFEPLAAVYFEFVKWISQLLGFETLIPLISALIFSSFLFVRRRTNMWILLFWFTTIGLLAPLINARYIVIVILLLIFPSRIVKWLAILGHWNFIVLVLSRARNFWIYPISLSAAAAILYLSTGDVLYEKTLHYLSVDDKLYGPAVFIEAIILFFVLREIYINSAVDNFLNNALSIGTIIFALLGLPVAASRILSLNIIISTYLIRANVPFYLSSKSKLGLTLVGSYELYRQLTMLGIAPI